MKWLFSRLYIGSVQTACWDDDRYRYSPRPFYRFGYRGWGW